MDSKVNKNPVCRLCASTIDDTYCLIFSPGNENLCEILNTCLPVIVKKNDNLPKQICMSCLTKIDDYQKFFFQVIEADKKLKALPNTAQISENNGQACMNCPMCVYGEMQVKDGRIILNSENGGDVSIVDSECVSKMLLQEVEVLKKKSDPYNLDTVSDVNFKSNVNSEYSCFTCGQGFPTQEEILTHVCSKNEEPLIEKPNETFPKYLPKEEEDPVQCDKCGKEYQSLKKLRDHKSFSHPRVYYTCEICDMKFPKKFLCTVHMRKHTGEKCYQCTDCDQAFTSHIYLWNHRNFHHNTNSLICDICQASGFYTKQDLNNHIRTKHTKERKFKCQVCDKSFMTSSVFYQHRFIHTNIRKYKCQFCTKTFQRYATLKNHTRIHTGERPFKCKVCGRGFRQKGDMRKHETTQHPFIDIDLSHLVEQAVHNEPSENEKI